MLSNEISSELKAPQEGESTEQSRTEKKKNCSRTLEVDSPARSEKGRKGRTSTRFGRESTIFSEGRREIRAGRKGQVTLLKNGGSCLGPRKEVRSDRKDGEDKKPSTSLLGRQRHDLGVEGVSGKPSGVHGRKSLSVLRYCNFSE